jgi:excisionase family DNA binding protein
METSRLLSVDEAAGVLGLTKRGVERLARAGKIGHFRIGRAIRFSPDQINDFLESVRVDPGRPGPSPNSRLDAPPCKMLPVKGDETGESLKTLRDELRRI